MRKERLMCPKCDKDMKGHGHKTVPCLDFEDPVFMKRIVRTHVEVPRWFCHGCRFSRVAPFEWMFDISKSGRQFFISSPVLSYFSITMDMKLIRLKERTGLHYQLMKRIRDHINASGKD